MNPLIERYLKSRFVWLVIIVLAALIFYRFTWSSITVSAQPIALDEVVAEVMGTGTLEARYQATVSAKIQGRIVELLADQNDRIQQGRLLARLDDAELLLEVRIARATLETARATVERLKAEEVRTKAVLEQAQRDYERYSSLVASKSVSQETVEKSREKLSVAEADLAKSAAATTESLRQVTTAQERLRFEEARLSDTRIVSPFDGLVVRRDRESGDIVVPGASIFQIISTKEMWIAAWVDESAMAGLGVGQPAKIVFRSQPDKLLPGTVARLGREVDRETREFRVDVKVGDLPANWAVGQRAEVYIETGRKSGVLVAPLEGIVWRDTKSGIFVVANGRATWKQIGLGLRGIRKVEISTGASKNDMLISDQRSVQLSDGQRVNVK